MLKSTHNPQWNDKGTYKEPTPSTDNVRVARLEVDDATTYVDKDGSDNMTLTDAVTGTKTLAQLSAAGTGTVDTSGTPVANDFAQFTDADTIRGRDATETKTDLSLENVENTAHSTDAHTMTIDGRDVSDDGNKLDTIGTNADVIGPGSSTNKAAARFSGTGGKTLQDSGVIVDDSDAISGVTGMDFALTATDQVFLDGRTNNRTDSLGVLRINLTPASGDIGEDCIHLDVDTNSVNDIMAIIVNYLATGLVAGNENMALELNVETANATGGVVSGIEVGKSGVGTLEVQGLHCNAGVIPIHQESGAFGTIEQAWEFESGPTWTDVTAAFNSVDTDVEIFSALNDIIYIGDAATFEEINVTLATVASGAGIKPTFEFSAGGSSWTAFTPGDSTNGFRSTGLIVWEIGDVPGWATDTVNSTTNKYWIRITRTRASLTTPPVEDKIEIAATTEYGWDENGVITANTLKVFDAGGETITGDGTDMTINSGNDINLTATTDINVPANVGVTFGDDGEKIEGNGTDLTIAGNNINLTAVADVVVPANVGITFGTGEKIEGDNTDLTVTSGGDIALTAVGDVNIPVNVGIEFAGTEKIESDGTDLNITVGATGDINVGADVGVTFGNDGEKIEGDGTNLTISGNNINLTAAADVVIPVNIGLHLGDGAEKLESDNANLTINSGGELRLTPTSDVVLPVNIGLHLGDGTSKLESNDTDLTINAGGDIALTATGDVNIPSGVGVTLGDDGEKIEGDGTDLTIASSNILNIDAPGNVLLTENTGIQLDAALSADEKFSGIVEAGTAGATLNFGDCVYHDVTAGEWLLAKADVTATSGAVKLGINVTVAQVGDGNAMTVLLWGKVRSDSDYAFTVDAPVFISAATAGDMTSVAPTGTTNFVVRIVGYGNTADELFFCPDNSYVELA